MVSASSSPSVNVREVPVDHEFARRTPMWTIDDVPPALLDHHRTGAWAELIVSEGWVRFEEPGTGYSAVARCIAPVVIVPDEVHRIIPSDDARFAIVFYRPQGA